MKSDRRTSIAWTYLLTLLAVAGCGGSSSSGPPPPPPADTTSPTVSAIQAPAGASINRVATISVTATDNVGVTVVRFFVDGTLLDSDDTAPFDVAWDTSGETDGNHVLSAEAEDAAGNIGLSGDTPVTVQNNVQFAVTPNALEEVAPVDSQGSAQANLTVNLGTGDVSGDLTVNGITATAAHIHDGFAGTNGPVLLPFDQDTGDPSLFTLAAGATLDAAGVDRLLAGALYVNVHTAAVAAGELRGQILPENFVLRFTELDGVSQVPRVDSFARGRAAVTLDEVSGTIVVQVQVEGLDDATDAHVHEAFAGTSGPVVVALTQDTADTSRWFAEGAQLNSAGLDAFAAGRLYVNVHSPDYPAGEIRGQILPEGITLLVTELSGEQEVPVVDTDAGGLAALTLDEAGALLTLHVNTAALDDASASHLHGAFGGANGPVEIGLTQDGSNPSHWFAENQVLSSSQLDTLLSGASYVNVHSPTHPGGEIRGQVIPDGILFARGRLDGGQEVPPVISAAGGTFAVTVDPDSAMLVAHANTTGAGDAVAAHLHDGYAGINGPVAIDLVQDTSDTSRWSAIDITLTTDQLDAFRAGRFYVNVHTPANLSGEVRGQVAPPPVEVLFTTLDGDQEVPAVTSTASGIAATTVDRDSGTVTLHLNVTGADDATAAHIHTAYAGQNGGVEIGLQQDPQDSGHWSASEAQLDDDGLADYVAGRLYVNLHTPANPAGEIRGQIAPPEIQVLFSTMEGNQVEPPIVTGASGVVATTTDLQSLRFVAFINGSDVDDATSAGIHVGGLGENGAEVLALQQTLMQPEQWSGVSEQLDAANLSAYRAGRLYAQVATPAQPGGEIRGQIVPPDAAEFDDQTPTVTLMSPGQTISGSVTLDADASDDQGVSEVRFFVDNVLIDTDTVAPYSISWDTTTVADGEVVLTAEAEDLAGNIGVSADVNVTVQNGVAVTLTQIQTQVFSPRCAGCHSGPTSGNLPSGMNLSNAAASHEALVDVTSLQVALDRVEPGDPDNSYLIRKLEGGPDISGSRMPQGGPFLDQETVDMIRQWISDDAPNN